MQLEKNINQLFGRFSFFWKKLHPQRLHNGKYIEGEPFDYLVIREGETCCFDAKECSKDVLYMSNIPIHQINDMLKAEKNGAIVFFLIYFVKSRKLCFIRPNTIVSDGKATPDSPQIECKLKKKILEYFS